MSSYIKDQIKAKIKIDPSQDLAKQLIRMVLQFEIRGEHPHTLNSAVFGVNKFIFTSDDRALVFELVGVLEEDLVDIIKEIPSIQKEFKVVSDPFNILIVYLVHLFLNAHIQSKIKEEVVIALLNYMQYRFMSSALNHYFPHGASYDIMQTVVEMLNLRFAIKQFNTWKNVISIRSESLGFNDKTHKNTLLKFNDDKHILYLITDISTKIRSQLKIITSEYYAIKDTNNFILSHSSTTQLDGEKIIREHKGSFELMSSIVFTKILNRSAWSDSRYIKMVQRSVPRLNTSIIQKLVLAISDEANEQSKTNESLKVINRRSGEEIFYGMEILVNRIIWFVYSDAISNDRINLNSKIAIYENAKRLFSASRSSDPTLINIKASIEELCKRNRITKREATMSGLTIALVLFITLHTFTVH